MKIVFKAKEETENLKLIRLTNVFVKLLPDANSPRILGNRLFGFSLEFPQNEQKFYAKNILERDKWMTMIRESLGCSNIFKFYELKVIFYFYIYQKGQYWKGSICRSTNCQT